MASVRCGNILPVQPMSKERMIRSAVSPNMIKKEIENEERRVNSEGDTKINIKSELDKGTTIEIVSNEIELGLHTELDIKCEHMEMFDDSNSCSTDNSNIETVDTDIKEDTENNVSIMKNNILIQSELDTKKKIMQALDNTNQGISWEISQTEFYTMQEQMKTDKIGELESSVLNTDTGNSSTNNTELALYKCNICNKQYQLKRSLSRHCREQHNRERVFECKICKKKLSTKYCLTVHLRTHSGERLYECEICKKKFLARYDLTVHLRTHNGERPYECEICKKKFIVKHVLTRHLRAHNGEKPYECKICNKNFRRKSYLNNHLRAHLGERPYQCEICKKKFITKHNLTVHLRTHSGEKPYECEMCKKKFKLRSYLFKHLRTHTGDKTI